MGLDQQVRPALNLITQIAAWGKIDDEVLCTAKYYLWLIYSMSNIENYVAATVACLWLSVKKHVRDKPNFNELLASTVLFATSFRKDRLKAKAPSFVRSLAPHIEEYESYLLHLNPFKPESLSWPQLLNKYVDLLQLQQPSCSPNLDRLYSVAYPFCVLSCDTKAILEYRKRPDVICVASLLMSARRLSLPYHASILRSSRVERNDVLSAMNLMMESIKQRQKFVASCEGLEGPLVLKENGQISDKYVVQRKRPLDADSIDIPSNKVRRIEIQDLEEFKSPLSPSKFTAPPAPNKEENSEKNAANEPITIAS